MTTENSTSDESDRFKIDHLGEIERILSGVMAKKALVTAYSDNKRDFLVTSLVEVDLAGRAIYFGVGQDESLNAALAGSSNVFFSTTHNQVRVQFATSSLTLTTRNGERVLCAEMPHELLRFQRREYYRLPTSKLKPVKCVIQVDDTSLETEVVDISLGGLGVLAYTTGVALSEGDVYHGCRLTLPEAGSYLVSLSIRAVYESNEQGGVKSRRVGCQFIDLAPSVETDIQRYIIRGEREHRARSL